MVVALRLNRFLRPIQQTPFCKPDITDLTQGHVVGRNILWPALGAGLPAGCRLFGDGRADSGSPGRAWFVPAALMWWDLVVRAGADCAAMNLNVSSLPVCLSDSGSPGWAWFVLAAPMWWEPVVRAGADRRPRGAQPCPALRLLRRSVRQSYDFSTAVTNWAGAVTQSW